MEVPSIVVDEDSFINDCKNEDKSIVITRKDGQIIYQKDNFKLIKFFDYRGRHELTYRLYNNIFHSNFLPSIEYFGNCIEECQFFKGA